MKIPKGKSKFIIIFCIIIQSQTIDRKHLYRLKQGSVVTATGLEPRTT